MELKKGEVICDKCNGKGSIDNTPDKNYRLYLNTRICPECHGEGKLDWIENLVGKDSIIMEWDTKPPITTLYGMNFNSLTLDDIKKVEEEINKQMWVTSSHFFGHAYPNYLDNAGKDFEKFKARLNYGFNYNNEGEEIE